MSAVGSRPVQALGQLELDRFHRKLDRSGGDEGCWNWTGSVKRKMPYGTVMIRGTGYISHRVAYFLAFGGDISGKLIAHKCDNARCCNPRHLFLTDDAGNNKDRDRKGRHVTHSFGRGPMGEQNGNSKLTKKIVSKIRSDNRKTKILSEVFGVNRTTINRIRSFKIWRNI